jgi:hypothetical protein
VREVVEGDELRMTCAGEEPDRFLHEGDALEGFGSALFRNLGKKRKVGVEVPAEALVRDIVNVVGSDAYVVDGGVDELDGVERAYDSSGLVRCVAKEIEDGGVGDNPAPDSFLGCGQLVGRSGRVRRIGDVAAGRGGGESEGIWPAGEKGEYGSSRQWRRYPTSTPAAWSGPTSTR